LESTYSKVGDKMIRGIKFIELVKKYYRFLVDEMKYIELDVTNREGLFYDVEYGKNDIIISISYENREDYLQVILFKLKDGKRPDYDDKQSTIHLDKLRHTLLKTLSNSDFKENDSYFASITTSSNFERKLLKLAKELRLCLKHTNVLA